MSKKGRNHLIDVSNSEFGNLRFAIKVGLCSALSSPISESLGRIEGPVKQHIRECLDMVAIKNPEIRGTLNDLYIMITEGRS